MLHKVLTAKLRPPPVSVSIRRRFGALDERPFRLLWLGQLISAVGDALVPVALAFAVLDRLDGSAGDLGVVLAAFMGSRMVFIVVGGVWSDRLPRQFVMIAADLVRAAVQAVIAVAFFTDAIQIWQLAVSSAIFGAASAFFVPASTGLVPTIVSRARLQQANALVGLSQSAVSIFGPALAGVLVALVGYGPIFAIDSLSFLGSAVCLLAMRLPAGAARVAKQTFVNDVARGLHEVRTRTWLWSAFITFSLSNVAIAVYFVLGPLVVAEHLGGASSWGLIMTGGAIGGLLGGALALRWRPRRPLIPAFVCMLSVSLQLLGLVPPLAVPLLMFGAMLAVGSIALGNAFWHTMLQQHVPQEAMSRVSALDWMVSLVFMPLGYTLAGPLSNAIGVDGTLVLAAGLGAAANLGLLLVPSVRNLTRRDEPHAVEVEPSEELVGPVAVLD